MGASSSAPKIRSKSRFSLYEEVKGNMQSFCDNDNEKIGVLSRDEVKSITAEMLKRHRPEFEPLTEEEVDLLIRIGSGTCQEITGENVPEALAVLTAIRDLSVQFRDLFVRFDTDKTGFLSADQLGDLLTEINAGKAPSSIDLKYVLDQCEPRGSEDPIPESQLQAAISVWYVSQTPVQLKIKAMFKAWDFSGTGVIDRSELCNVISRLDSSFTEEKLDVLFRSIDTNGDGVINYSEFVDFVMDGGVELGAGVPDIEFMAALRLVPYGVLGTQIDKKNCVHQKGPLPSASVVIVDPAGLDYIQPPGGPSGAGGAAGAIYEWLGIKRDERFPADVIEAVTKVGDAKYHVYPNSRHVIHAVGPDFRRGRHTWESAVGDLAGAYENIFREFLASKKQTLRMLPVSGGIFSGNFKSRCAELTMVALRQGCKRLPLEMQTTLLHRSVQLCVFKTTELAQFRDALGLIRADMK